MTEEKNTSVALAPSLVPPQVIKKPKRWDLPFGRDVPPSARSRDMTELELDMLMDKAPFSEMDISRFPNSLPLREILRNDTRILYYRDGDAVIRKGDYGNSAFLILEGHCRAIVDGLDQRALGRLPAHQKGLLSSLTSLFTNPKSPEVRDARLYPQFFSKNKESPLQESNAAIFVQDVPNVLRTVPDAYDITKNNIMPCGSHFGELGALGRVSRAVTVVASDPDRTVLLEIRWQGLRDIMKFDDAWREDVNQQFRSYGLQGALQASTLLTSAKLNQDQWDQVVASAEFETFGTYDWYGTYQQLRQKEINPLSQEPVISEAGQYPNGLILVHAGFGRLSKRLGSSEHTYGYLSKGEVYGLEELIHNVKTGDQLPLQTTLRATGYMDIVRIPTRTFESIIYPAMDPSEIKKIEDFSKARRQIENSASHKTEATKQPKFDPSMTEFLVENRVINGTQTMVIDLDRCTRCDECVHACASGHSNNPRFLRHGMIHGHYMIANACMHCEDPVCMIGCPTGAIHRSEGDGEVVINDLTCIGCSTCANSCPYENIRMVNVRNQTDERNVMIDLIKGSPIVKATKCDLCLEHHGGPACERACPHDALKRLDMKDLNLLTEWFGR